jgi:hypothetical protein
MKPELSALEAHVLERILAGDRPVLRILQKQLKRCRVKSREFTGVGFMTELDLPADVERVRLCKHETKVGGVVAATGGLEHGAGFVLYLKDGLLDALEGYSYDETWPQTMQSFELRYTSERERDLDRLEDLAKVD